MVGAGLGFLWFNAYPAQMFMGDVGSLALGGALGTVALITKQELLLLARRRGLRGRDAVGDRPGRAPSSCGGKRIFRMAPIHHHFELLGWPEPQIIVRFWIVAIVCALRRLATLKLR